MTDQSTQDKFADMTIKSIPTFPESIQAAKEKREQSAAPKSPGRRQLVMAVAGKFFVTPEEAEQWLVAEFGAVREAA